jgi:3-isopropylmalate/(R)-2-methylmalate dehydratase small subunit
MQPFITHRGKLAVLDWTDVNTDLIIPARYLKRIERTGYGPLLFADKRYLPGSAPEVDDPEAHGELDPSFPLNQRKYEGASILVVGRNFGCGSSREHAVWAVAQAGFRVLISPGVHEGYADIFEQNALNNGLLPIEIPTAAWNSIVAAIEHEAATEATVDLEAQTISLHNANGGTTVTPFALADVHRNRLLAGLDAIGETLSHEAQIAAFEAGTPSWWAPNVV